MDFPKIPRRLAWLLVCGLLAACAARGVQMQESPWLRTFERKSGLIAYVGMDGNLYTINQAGDKQYALTGDGGRAFAIGQATGINPYARPFAWSPDGTQVAFMEYGEEAWLINVSDVEGAARQAVFVTQSELPHMLGWSPDGRFLSFITQVDPALTGGLPLHHLWLSPLNPVAELEPRLSAAGIFYAIEPAGGRVLAHSLEQGEAGYTGRLALLSGDGAPREVGATPAAFLAPAWSPDGLSLLFAAQEDRGGNALVIANLQGQPRQTVTTFETAVAFAWSPDGRYVAYIDSVQERQGALGHLFVMEAATGETVFTSAANLVHAFFWSPDSARIVFFTKEIAAADEQQITLLGALGIHFLHLEEGDVLDYMVDGVLFQFRPTGVFLEMLTRFDQYSRFATIWSPNGEKIVIPAVTADGQGVVYVLATSGNLAPRPIVDGVMAFWSPR
jgi:TolB protein